MCVRGFLVGGKKEMIMDRNVQIITDLDGKKLVIINDIIFKGKQHIKWVEVENYLKRHKENLKYSHRKTAEKGWYRYNIRFALPVYNNLDVLEHYNIFDAVLIVRHASDDKLYLYDIINIKKKKQSKPLE